jgi:hypothetical protein
VKPAAPASVSGTLKGWCVDPSPVFGDWCRDGSLDDGTKSFNLQEDVRLFARWEKN